MVATTPIDTTTSDMFPTGEELANIALPLEGIAKQYPHKPAIIYPYGRDPKTGQVSYTHFTYSQMIAACDQIAAGLGQIGIVRGTKTVLLVTPSLEFFALAFAMFRAGIVPVIIDPGIDRAALKQCIGEAEPEAFIGVTRAHIGRIAFGWGKETMDTRKLVTVGKRLGWGGYTLEQVKALAADAPPFEMADTRAAELAAIVFTSGSTGIPKGVMYSHGNFAAQIQMIKEELSIEPGEVDLPTFPLFALFDPSLGMTTVIPDMDPTRPAEVDPTKIIEAIEDFGVTNMFGSPALLNTLSRYGAAHEVKLPTLKRVISAGAPVPAETMERMMRMLPADARMWTPYGATESLPVAMNHSDVILKETRFKTVEGAGVCIGRPVGRANVRVIGITDDAIDTWDDSLVVPTGTVGEITVQSPTTTRAYFNRDEKTRLAKIATEDGGVIHRMGDLGYFDEQGRLWFAGRKKHRVETAEGPLYTILVEPVFNAHPKVYRTALVGVGEYGAQTPVLLIELEPDQQRTDRDKLIEELKAMGAAYPHTARIEHVLFHPGFPVDIRHNSKIFREKLAPWAAERLQR